jgi:hypothetical protein
MATRADVRFALKTAGKAVRAAATHMGDTPDPAAFNQAVTAARHALDMAVALAKHIQKNGEA